MKTFVKMLFLQDSFLSRLLNPNGDYPKCKVPDEIKKSKILSSEFLKSFSSCDGCIYFNPKKSVKYIEIRCYHPKLRKDIIKCFNNLEIKCLSKSNSIIISNISNLRKFYDNIGFLRQSLVSDTNSKHFGKSKMNLLTNALH